MSPPGNVNGAPAPGTILGEKYRVLEMIGSGGMGSLVKAEHLLLKKAVAIKFIRGSESSQARSRLFREARAAQALSSENVVRVFDLGVHADAPYIVMELLEGVDLESRIDEGGPLAAADAVDCLLEACAAVAEAHANGIIHRDIKPSNLFWTRAATWERVKVLDFGISKVPERLDLDGCATTGSDAVLGSPYYMSPEQLRNPATVDGRTDVWALGVTLHYLLTGQHPFDGRAAQEVMAAVFADEPRDVCALRPGIPEELSRVLRRALAKRPEDRTQTVSELAQALAPFASERGTLAASRAAALARPAGLAAAGLGVPRRSASEADAQQTASAAGSTTEAAGVLDASASDTSGARRRRRVRRAATVSAVVVLGAAVWVWLPIPPSQGNSPTAPQASTAPPASAPAAPTSTVRVEVASPESGADTAMASQRPSAAPAAPSAPPKPRLDPPPAPPRETKGTAPATSASASAPIVAPSVRRDADGVPILE